MHGEDDGHRHPPAGTGHNRPGRAAQWQVPHRTDGERGAAAGEPERDLDLVEESFLEGFSAAPDPTSFLRLAGIPFVGIDGAGRRLHLLRVETGTRTDVGSVTPLLGGTGGRYDPLPARMVSRRRTLAFAYHDGTGLRHLTFAEARGLADASGPARLDLPAGERRTG